MKQKAKKIFYTVSYIIIAILLLAFLYSKFRPNEFSFNPTLGIGITLVILVIAAVLFILDNKKK